jgi:hypothetical protein
MARRPVQGKNGAEQLLRRTRAQPAVGSSSSSRSGAFHQRDRHGQDLALAAAQGACRRAALLAQHGEALVELGHALPGMRAIDEAAHLQVLGHGHRAEDVALLRHEGQPLPADGGCAEARDVAALEQHLSAAWPQQPGDELEQRRFARTIGGRSGRRSRRRRP